MAQLAFLLALLLGLLAPASAQAKRAPAPRVEPAVHGGVQYVAPNDSGRRGYVQAWDTATGKKLWEVTVFRNFINPLVEHDVQWVFIKRLSVVDGRLVVEGERNRAYTVDLKTRKVRKLKKSPPP